MIVRSVSHRVQRAGYSLVHLSSDTRNAFACTDHTSLDAADASAMGAHDATLLARQRARFFTEVQWEDASGAQCSGLITSGVIIGSKTGPQEFLADFQRAVS